MTILKRYLTEVVFINGTDEFKSYRHYTKKIVVTEQTDTIDIELEHKEIDLTSIVVEIQDKYDVQLKWKSVNNEHLSKISVYTNNTNTLLKDDVILVTYTALNETSSDLYSVDYENGVLYLASETNIPLIVEYKCYNNIIKGRKTEQLHEDQYNVDAVTTEVFNYDNTTNYRLVYNTNTSSNTEYTTPIVSGLKVNFINTSEQETF